MNYKQEAEALVNKFKTIVKAEKDCESGGYDLHQYEQDAKQCALLHVNEMIELFSNVFMTEGSLFYQHLLDLKSEIEKL